MTCEIRINVVYPTVQYQIRKMYATDIPTVAAIDRDTWNDKSWSLENFFEALYDLRYNCWILENISNDPQILGYGFQYKLRDVSHIANLCIHPKHRGYGLGGILLQHMIDNARQTDNSRIELEVLTSNTHAYKLYYKYGFRETRFLFEYYSDGADAYRMTRFL